ncbi:MAG: hypothetical protein QXR26_02775 [Candidatus Caldarchaeum sp.]
MTSLRVTIAYGELKAEFEGAPEEVYLNVVRFLEKSIPAYSLAARLQKSVGVEELLEKLRDKLVYIQGEGVVVKTPLSNLPTSNAILLYASARYLSHLLGFVEKPECTSSEFADVMAKPEKTISGRLTELVQKNFLKRVGRGGYVITVLGLNYLAESSASV